MSLSKRSQSENATYCVILTVCYSRKEYGGKKISVYWGVGGEQVKDRFLGQ